MKKYIRQCLRSVGYDVTPVPVPHLFLLREYTLRVFSVLGINIVLDVGAHWDDYGPFLRNSGYRGRVVSFEPVSSNFAILSERAAQDPLWKSYKLALGNEDTVRPIPVTARAGFSAERLGEMGRVVGTEMAEVKQLDSVLEECMSGLSDTRVFLKMDVQGCDLKVLQGAARHIDRILALQSLLCVENISTGMASYLDVIAQMTQLGFDIAGMVPIATHKDGLRGIDFDCIMVRRP